MQVAIRCPDPLQMSPLRDPRSVLRALRWPGWLIIILIAFAPGCSEDADEIRIRIKNTSDLPYTEFFVASGVALLDGTFFGTIAPGAYSEYKTFAKAYGIAYIRFIANGQERTFIPIDYVGESTLKPGRYTYEIGLSGSGPNDVTFAFRTD